MKHLGDITGIDGGEIEPVDVITFGSPCQDLSIAGARAGLDGDQSGLFLEAVRIIREMRCKTDEKYPTFAVWENVPGAFSSNKGEDFRRVLQELAALCDDTVSIPRPAGKWLTVGEIMGDDWSIAWRVMDAQYWGVPQRRRRIALVVDFGGQRAGQILFEPKSVSGDPQPRGAAAEKAAGGVGDGVDLAEGPLCGGFKGKSSADSKTVGFEIDRCPTLTAGQVCHVVYDARGNGSVGTIVPTLTGDHQNRITDYTALCVQGYELNQIASPTCRSNPQPGDPMPTLSATGRAGITYCIMSTQEHAGIDNDLCGTLSCKHEQPVFVVYLVVRRPTPLECERLQGYQDGWTDIPDYTDSHGKRRRASDSARYTALGNTIALPQWRYVLGNISKYLPRAATLGSLFDGIGGFPLVWEEIHGAGSAVWASEINEFCIAVTKYRFGG